MLPLVIGVGFNYFLNIVNICFYRRNISLDPEFQKWLKVSRINQLSNILIAIFSLFLSFKATKFIVSKYFGFK